MLWVGTNNHGHTAEQICGGIMAIIQVIKNKLPHARTLVLVGFFCLHSLKEVLIYLPACLLKMINEVHTTIKLHSNVTPFS